MFRIAGFVVAVLLGWGAPAAAQDYPVTVRSCSESVTFDGPPQRPIVNDTNMVQTIVDMGLLDRFMAVTGIDGAEHYIKGVPAVIEAMLKKQVKSPGRYPSLEGLLTLKPDFYFGGWQYGFSEQIFITPERLAGFNIKSYILNESCIRVGPRAPISMDTLYTDILALGRIFGITARAEAMVADFRQRVATVTSRTATVKQRYRVMYCGDCNSDAAFLTIGAEGMPKLLATLAGGQNIFDDIPDSYVRVTWDRVIPRDPEWIIISDNRIPTDDIVRYLTTNPRLKDLTAVKKRQFVFMTYPERSPSTRNVEALERLARTLHPELF